MALALRVAEPCKTAILPFCASAILGAGPAGRTKVRPNSLPANLSNLRVRTKTSLTALKQKAHAFGVGLLF